MLRLSRSQCNLTLGFKRSEAIRKPFFGIEKCGSAFYSDDAASGSSNRQQKKGSAFRYLFYGAGVTLISVGGTLAYAHFDPNFRKELDDNIPQASPYIDMILGKPKEFISGTASSNSVAGVKKIDPQIPVSPLPQQPKKQELPPSSPPATDVKKESVKKDTSNRKEDIKKDEATRRQIEADDVEKKKANATLEKQLKELRSYADERVKKAVDAKNAVVMAINNHSKLLRNAVEDPETQKKDPQWQWVSQARETMDFALRDEKSASDAARTAIEELRRAIKSGRVSKFTGNSQHLLDAEKALTDHEFQMDSHQAKIREAENEGKIMNEFKTLIEQGRAQFAAELKSILPRVDIKEKGTKLSEEELNALIAHAHLRVDQLRKQLADQQLREETHIREAMEKQKAADAGIREEAVQREAEKGRKQAILEAEEKLNEAQQKFEEELRQQLRRSAAAHSEHLEEVLRVQRVQLDIEHQRQLSEAIQRERELFQRDFIREMNKLEGIEKALEGRVEWDLENRRAKELWLSAQQLHTSIFTGRPGRSMDLRRKPLANDIVAVKEASNNNAFVNTVVSTVPDEALVSGVYPEEDLISHFYRVKKLCKRTAMIGENGGTLLEYVLSFLQSLFIIDRPRECSSTDEVDPSTLDTFGILSRATYCMQHNDLETAVRLMQLLKGEPKQLAQSWIEDVRVFLETALAAKLLLAHAAAIGVRSVY